VRQLARDHAFEVLIVREIDRLARDAEKFMRVKRTLLENEVRIEFVSREYGDDWRGMFMEGLDAVWAQAERAQIVERTRRGKRNSVRAGNVTCCGAPPYGYREATVDGKRTLAIDAEEAEVVRMMYRLYLEGNGKGEKHGCKAIAKRLTDRKVPSHSDKGNTINNKAVSDYGTWDHHPVMRILKAPVYKGEWQYGKRTDNPITIPVPRIISDEDWEAVQVIRKKNRRVRKYSGQYDFMLQGDVYCSSCGKPMSPQMKRSPKVAYSYYIHRPHPVHHGTNGNRCTGHANYSAKAVDDAVWAYTKKILSNPDELAGGFRKYAERLKSGNNPTRDKLDTAQKQVDSTERELSRLVHLYTKEKITETQYDEMKNTLDIQLDKHSEDVDVLSQELEQSAKLEDHMQSITKFAEVAAAKLNTKYAAKIENRREVISRLGMRVELGQDDKNRYADTLFIASDLSQIRCTLRIARHLGSQTSLPPTIYRTRITLPPRRARRSTRSAS
jgi:site-specific DNA recombinase